MKAIQLTSHGQPGRLEARTLPNPVPGSKDVVVEVAGCGLNHLDLWLEAGALPIPISLPRTPGCEVAGRVLQTGSAVTGWHTGDRVAIQSNLFCGECEFCLRGEESLCLHNEMLGVQRDGGFAEQVVVPARALARLPDNVDFVSSAALTLAGSTAMHMLTSRAHVRPGDWVLVMAGASGVGSAAIQIARALGARVISTGSTEAKRALAQRLGAEHVIDLANCAWSAEVRKLTGKRGVDLVIEHVGGEVLAQSFQCLARGGVVVTCGATAGRQVTLDIWPLFAKQQQLVGSYGRNRVDFENTLAWAAAGKLKPVLDSVVPLEDVPAAIARLRARQVLGKIVAQLGEPIAASAPR